MQQLSCTGFTVRAIMKWFKTRTRHFVRSFCVKLLVHLAYTPLRPSLVLHTNRHHFRHQRRCTERLLDCSSVTSATDPINSVRHSVWTLTFWPVTVARIACLCLAKWRRKPAPINSLQITGFTAAAGISKRMSEGQTVHIYNLVHAQKRGNELIAGQFRVNVIKLN